VRRWLSGALLVTTSVLAAACGASAAPQTFHPAGATSTGAASTPAPSASSASGPGSLTWPPFGKNAHVAMTPWLPAQASEIPAVTTAKNFLLAVLYADYTGGQDHSWMSYAGSPKVRTGMAATLAQPGVTTESFTGTVRIWRMSALASPGPKGTIEVTECIDSSRARNTGLNTGKVLPKSLQVPTDQNYYSNSDVLAKDSSGHWRVVSIPPAMYYPQALECR
jgi:hypothetical protein